MKVCLKKKKTARSTGVGNINLTVLGSFGILCSANKIDVKQIIWEEISSPHPRNPSGYLKTAALREGLVPPDAVKQVQGEAAKVLSDINLVLLQFFFIVGLSPGPFGNMFFNRIFSLLFKQIQV